MQAITVQAAPAGQGPPPRQAAAARRAGRRARSPSATRRAGRRADRRASRRRPQRVLRTRPPPAGGPDRGAVRAEGRRASEEAEQRHRELLDKLRAANRTRDAIAATVASPFKIAPL